jgi:hypothetical protein
LLFLSDRARQVLPWVKKQVGDLDGQILELVRADFDLKALELLIGHVIWETLKMKTRCITDFTNSMAVQRQCHSSIFVLTDGLQPALQSRDACTRLEPICNFLRLQFDQPSRIIEPIQIWNDHEAFHSSA